MNDHSYLHWLLQETPTSWWHDSADPDELSLALTNGASGVTTNPLLVYRALSTHPAKWPALKKNIPKDLSAEERAECLVRMVVGRTAETLRPEFDRTSGKSGYVCAQVNPSKAADVEFMTQMAIRFQRIAPNITVKLPATAAGLDALEECAARGIHVTVTVSFTVPQVIAVAERYRQGMVRARKAGITPGRCFAVIMIGRLDEYLRDVAADRKAKVREADILQAGLAVTKRAYSIFKARNYETVLLVAALRGAYHMEELAGAELIMSLAPGIQAMLQEPGVLRDPYRIDAPIASDAIQRLQTIPDFVRAYEPDGMNPDEFISFGLTQRTLTQFIESGWSRLPSVAD